ncbi:MAG: hypothetical protein JWM53_5782 [bacterium]|nr:hypothetical protein [bacterium]
MNATSNNADSYRIAPSQRRLMVRDALYILAIVVLAAGLLYERSARQADVDRAVAQAAVAQRSAQGVRESFDRNTVNDMKTRDAIEERIHDLSSRINALEERLGDDNRKAKH